MKRLRVLYIFWCLLLANSSDVYCNKKIMHSDGPNVSYKVRLLLDSAKSSKKTDPIRAIDYSSRALELSLINHYQEGEGLAYKMLGNIHYELGHYDLAASNQEDAIEAFTREEPRKKIASSYKDKAKFAQGGSLDLFISYSELALSYIELSNFPKATEAIEHCFTNEFSSIGNAYRDVAKQVRAKILIRQKKLNEGVAIYETILQDARAQGNTVLQCDILLELGKVYFEEGSYDRALPYFTASKELAEMLKRENIYSIASEYMAQIYRQQKKLDEEVQLRQGSVTRNISAKNSAAASKGNLEIGNAYISANQTDSGISYLTKGLDQQVFNNGVDANGNIQMSYKSKELSDRANAYKALTDAYLIKGDKQKAKETFDKYLQLQDSVEVFRKEEIKNALELSTTLGKKQQRVELLEKERELNEKAIGLLKKDQVLKDEQLSYRNFTIWSLVIVMLAMAGAGYSIVRSARAKRKANQLLAMKSLRSQMNPHFIFNALNSVNHYVSQNDERSANKYLSDFSRLMRLVMENSKHDFISLSEEVEILELYLQLEHERFRDKFDYTFTVDENIDTAAFELPPMLLQPYIENSVWHGLRYLDHKGFLKVNIDPAIGGIKVTIEDNGIGRKLSQEQKTVNQKKQHSSGMQNIENRVKIMNDIFGVTIAVNVEDARPGEEEPGTRVNIFISNRKPQN